MANTPPTPINRLILIGNGFDLAHGMKTGYKDFIVGYFRKCLEEAKINFTPSRETTSKKIFDDELLRISINPFRQADKPIISDMDSFDKIKKLFNLEGVLNNQKPISYSIKSEFLSSLVNNLFSKNWVDIENYYYNQMIKIIYPTRSPHNPRGDVDFKKLTKLNKDFELIKLELADYLKTIHTSRTIDGLIESIYEEPLKIPHSAYPVASLGNVMFLNFNYTSTPELYRKEKTDIIYIHGELDDSKHNPIIFGYGDERDESYNKLEKANNPDVFTHIKSFDYFKTNNYARLLAFLEAPFDLYIMGHSCGLSDRTLLSTIFEHDNCRLIKIFYYENLERYRETTYEMSRHFTSKAEMRRKVINFKDCSPMPQLLST